MNKEKRALLLNAEKVLADRNDLHYKLTELQRKYEWKESELDRVKRRLSAYQEDWKKKSPGEFKSGIMELCHNFVSQEAFAGIRRILINAEMLHGWSTPYENTKFEMEFKLE